MTTKRDQHEFTCRVAGGRHRGDNSSRHEVSEDEHYIVLKF